MASKLKSFPITVRAAGELIYPYLEWTDGDIWKLVRGEDFHCKIESMRGTYLKYCRDHGMIGRTARVPNEDAIAVQSSTGTSFK